MENKHCAIDGCRKSKCIGKFCARHYGDKFWMKIRLCLEDNYKNCNDLKRKASELLPDPLSLKDIATFLNFLRIGYNMQDLKIMVQTLTEKSTVLIARERLINLIFMPVSSWDVEASPIVLPKLSKQVQTAPLPRIEYQRNLSPFSSFKALISEKLRINFKTPEEAFYRFTKSKNLDYFGLTRMLSFLDIPSSEQIIKDLTRKSFHSATISKEQFKTLFLNSSGKHNFSRLEGQVGQFMKSDSPKLGHKNFNSSCKLKNLSSTFLNLAI